MGIWGRLEIPKLLAGAPRLSARVAVLLCSKHKDYKTADVAVHSTHQLEGKGALISEADLPDEPIQTAAEASLKGQGVDIERAASEPGQFEVGEGTTGRVNHQRFVAARSQ